MKEDRISDLEWARLNCRFFSFCVGKSEVNCKECNDGDDVVFMTDTQKMNRGVTYPIFHHMKIRE